MLPPFHMKHNLKINWDEWRGAHDGRPVLYIKTLASWGEYKLQLHKFVRGDDPGCYHSHPAKALRLILWGGYIEKVLLPVHPPSKFISTICIHHKWWPLKCGIVRPELVHRIMGLRGGACYTLWLRWPKTHAVELIGDGWPEHAEPAP